MNVIPFGSFSSDTCSPFSRGSTGAIVSADEGIPPEASGEGIPSDARAADRAWAVSIPVRTVPVRSIPPKAMSLHKRQAWLQGGTHLTSDYFRPSRGILLRLLGYQRRTPRPAHVSLQR